MDHLRREGRRCNLHFGLVQYMEKLFCKSGGELISFSAGKYYTGSSKMIGHKAMYNEGDAKWKIAEAAEQEEVAIKNNAIVE